MLLFLFLDVTIICSDGELTFDRKVFRCLSDFLRKTFASNVDSDDNDDVLMFLPDFEVSTLQVRSTAIVVVVDVVNVFDFVVVVVVVVYVLMFLPDFEVITLKVRIM